MLLDLVERFVEERLMPLERDVLAREAAGQPLGADRGRGAAAARPVP